MISPTIKPLIAYIQTELNVPEDAIAIAFRNPLFSPNHLPVALWQLGLISLDDVSKIFDWLENFGASGMAVFKN